MKKLLAMLLVLALMLSAVPYMLPAYVLNQTVMYNTAAVEVPEAALEAGGVNYCWSQWKMLK